MMKRFLAASLATLASLFATRLLAQCQATLLTQTPGVCNNGGWHYEEINVPTAIGMASDSFYSPQHVTVTIPFYPTSNMAGKPVTVGRFMVVPLSSTAYSFYDAGVLVVTVSDAASATVLINYLHAHYAGKLGWWQDVKDAFYGGIRASDGCNRATANAGFMALVGILSAQEGSVSGTVGAAYAMWDAYQQELAACR